MASKKEKLTKLTQDLIRFKTTKENINELKKCVKYIKEYFADCDVVIKEFESNNKPSLVISYEETKNPKLLLNGHIDVVEAEEEQYNPRIEGDKLFGRGSVDMKAGVAALMLLMKEFSKKEKKPDMALMIVPDEEIGGMDGTRYLLEQGYRAGFAIAAEPNHTDELNTMNIVIKEKGVLWLKVVVRGKAAHGARPWNGENAAEKILKVYEQIKSLFEETTEKDRWKSTINLGKIVAGNSPNKVPDKAEFIVDIRFTEETSSKELIEKIKQIEGVELEVLEDAPILFNKDLTWINKLKETIEKITGNKSELQNNHGASDLAYASEKGIESAIFGPYGLNYHGKEEFVYLSSLELYYKVMKEFISTV